MALRLWPLLSQWIGVIIIFKSVLTLFQTGIHQATYKQYSKLNKFYVSRDSEVEGTQGMQRSRSPRKV